MQRPNVMAHDIVSKKGRVILCSILATFGCNSLPINMTNSYKGNEGLPICMIPLGYDVAFSMMLIVFLRGSVHVYEPHIYIIRFNQSRVDT